jgi:Cu/Ag efflux protein CusF
MYTGANRVTLRVMKRIHLLTTTAAAVLSIATLCLGQAPAKKPLTFHGKVEAVNSGEKSLTVNGEKVEGWMDAMTMSYKVDDPSVLKQVKVGDDITATVYQNDKTSLHNVKVAPAKSDKKEGKKKE